MSARTLQECEAVIARGLDAYSEVGGALLEIHDRKLYRTTHKTFEEYALARWAMTSQRAYQLMTATGVTEVLAKTPTIVGVPKTESVARELAPLRNQPQVMAQVWEGVVARTPAGKTPTAAAVRRAVSDQNGACLTGPMTDFLHYLKEVVGLCAEVAPLIDRIGPDDLMALSLSELNEGKQYAHNVRTGLRKLAGFSKTK